RLNGRRVEPRVVNLPGGLPTILEREVAAGVPLYQQGVLVIREGFVGDQIVAVADEGDPVAVGADGGVLGGAVGRGGGIVVGVADERRLPRGAVEEEDAGRGFAVHHLAGRQVGGGVGIHDVPAVAADGAGALDVAGSRVGEQGGRRQADG